MKKIFTLLAMALVALTASADKTVTFDFSDPTAFGYEAPAESAGTTIPNGGTIEKDGVIITNNYAGTSTTAVRFFKSSASQGSITTFRLASDGSITITAPAKIKALSIVGKYTEYGTNFSSNVTTGWADQIANTDGTFTSNWEGEANSITITRLDKTIQMYSMEVTYAEGEGGGGAQTETYEAVTYDAANGTYTAAAVFANATVADGQSIVTFGTTNMEVTAVGGTTAKTCDATGVTEWNNIQWDLKNHLNDNAADLHYGMIVGTGNPVFGYDIEEVVTDGVGTGNYRQKYDGYYYTPDCGEMPAQGLYYKFHALADGELKIFVWANKGNRNTYLVDEATTQPVDYKAEGYMNNKTDEGTGLKRLMDTEEVESLKNPDKPYVIAGQNAGGQAFWGNVIVNIKADQTLWLFQDSSQIGFHGYEFTTEGSTGIENITAAPALNSKAVFNLAGQRVKANTKGIVIINGKKVLNK